MKGMGMLCSSCVFLVISLSTLLDQTNSLMCWQNTYSADNPWRIQECDIAAGNETTCLSQYRIHNGVQIPSYFGCHTPNTPCNRLCRVTEGQSNDYSCCCSGDLCNSLPEITPNASDPSGLCKQKQCSQSCVVQGGSAQCYCDWGFTLDIDGRTCIDTNECEHNNGGCEGTCHNEIGTGFHCACADNQILKDGFRCEDYPGLMCYNQNCNGMICSAKKRQLCGTDSSTNDHCQATYVRDNNGTFNMGLLSCFRGGRSCEQGGCVLKNIGSSTFYYCCCDGNLCNNNITFPTD